MLRRKVIVLVHAPLVDPAHHNGEPGQPGGDTFVILFVQHNAIGIVLAVLIRVIQC
ncbi:hypothetical protein D3C71_2112350 [compost metagenome]